LEWRRPPRYSPNSGVGEAWDLHDLDDALVNWRTGIRGRITYLGLTRAANWADRMQQWRIDRRGGDPLTRVIDIEAQSVEEAKATALAILLLTN
jgi:hypothetical protein